MPASTGYTVNTITDLKNISTDIRVTGYLRFVLDTTSWYVFIETATNTPDNVNIIQPTNGSGRWFRLKSYVLASDVNNLQETIEDVIGAALINSSTITFSYNDAAGTIQANIATNAITNTHVANNALSISKINSLESQLNSKANTIHNHVPTDITDLIETIQDSVAAFLQAGSNIVIDYNDQDNLLTISSSGGGSGGITTWDTIDIDTWDGL